MNDWDLLRQYVETRSQPAFAELVARHSAWIRSSARRQLRDVHLADDVMQAVFVALDRQAHKLSAERGALSTWLFQVTRYASRAALRSESRRQRHEREAAVQNASNAFDSMTPGQWGELAPKLDLLVSRLRTDDQRAVLLRFFQQKSYPEMAAVLGISEDAARKRTDRAIDKLRQMTQSGGLTLSAGALSAGLLARSTDAAPMSASAASPHTIALAKGALTMMTLTRLKLPAALAASFLVLAIGTAAWLNAAEPAAQTPAQASARFAAVPATTQALDSTPKGLVLGAFKAAAGGNADDLVARFDQLNEAQEAILRQAAGLMAASDDLRKAVSEKFGANMEAEFATAIGMGVVLGDITDATETVEGETALVDIGSGPGKIPCVKVNGQWKISGLVLHGLNPKAVAGASRNLPAIKALAADIRAGRYKTLDELQQTMRGFMQRPASSRPTAAPQAPINPR